jgi:hypothetical protein
LFWKPYCGSGTAVGTDEVYCNRNKQQAAISNLKAENELIMAPSELHKDHMDRYIQFCYILHFLIGQIKKYFIKLNVISEIYKTNLNG